MIYFDNVSFHYGGEQGTGEGVDNLKLEIGDGEFVVLCGTSGCGKTTITRLINGLAPHFYEGIMEGEVWIDGNENKLSVTKAELSETAAFVGSVFQNPKSQFFNIDTTGELAFGCENRAMEREEIARRLEKTKKELQLENLLGRNIFELSGGEKQQIACGSVYATDPLYYVMDEPSSNLDRKAINRLHAILHSVKENGKTVVISEHRLYYLMDLADRFLYVEDGRIAKEFSREEMKNLSEEELEKLGLRCTDLKRLRREKRKAADPGKESEKKHLSAKPALEGLDLCCTRGNTRIVDIERLAIPVNSVVALIGDNGSGKSTLAEGLCGVSPMDGSVAFDGTYLTAKQRTKKSFMVMQDVNRQLFLDNVRDEVMLNTKATKDEAAKLLGELGLGECLERHPASLSGGQKQRVAIACALLAEKEIVFYDEPTSGLDRRGMERFAEILKSTGAQIKTSVIITHDPELILKCCTHVAHVENGRLLAVYPLDEEGMERLMYYFLSDADDSKSVRREKVGMLGKIMGYAGKWKKTVIGAVILMIIASLISMVPYYAIYDLIKTALEGRAISQHQTLWSVGMILCSQILYAIFYMMGLDLSHHAAFHTLENVRCTLQEKLERQSLGSVKDMGSGSIKKLFSDDVESIELLLAHMIPEGLGNLAVAAGVMVLMIYLDWKMAVLTAIMIGIGFGVSREMYSVGVDKMGNYFAASKRLNNTIVEYVNGMDVVRVYNREEEAGEKYRRNVFHYRDLTLAWFQTCWPWMALYGSTFSMSFLLSLPLGVLFVITGNLTLTGYVLVLCLSFGLGNLLLHCIGFVGALPQVTYKIQALEKAMDRLPLKTGEEEFKGRGHDVCFEKVRFSYQGKEVMKSVDLVAREGEVTALVGPSGSGKTTVARLLAHDYDVEYGSITIGGQDIRGLSPKAHSDQIAVVSQDLFLFNDTILENIRIGKPGASDAEVMETARKAQRADFIEELPQGYYTMAGEAGGKLSGGQRQRITFARAILKNAPVVILDEATAFIDPENEQKMEAAIREIVKGKTVIVIAHRMHQIQNADRIIVLNQGRVEAVGRHNALIKECPLYQTLWRQSEESGNWSLSQGGTGI